MIKNLLQEGFLLKKKGYYKHSIKAFYKALELDNTSLELLLEIADCYYLMNNEERTLSYIEQILNKNPMHVDSLKLLEKIFINKNALEEAEQTAKNIYCITNNIKDLAKILQLLNKQEKYNEIFEYNSSANSPEILYQKAYAKFKLNNYSEAEKFINEALSQNYDIDYLILKGKILLKLNKYTECLENLQNINTEIPNPHLYNLLGLLKINEADFKTALNYFLKAVKFEPGNDEFLYNCASTYFKTNNIDFAKKYYNLAISIKPDNPNYHFALANLYYSQKKYKRALKELNYDIFEAKLLKAIILHDTGYLAIAQKEFKKLAEIQQNNPVISEYLNKIKNELKI